MIKAEISEIKKLFKINTCSVTRICGCYVNGDKDIINTWNQNFLAMDEEDLYKYLDLFRKCLSGALNKTLFNIKPNQRTCEELHQLKRSKLQDEDMLIEFYQRIIDDYEYVGNYLILVIHDVYDIPGKSSDNLDMEDASDEVYEYIMACICPVSLATPALGYSKEKNIFTHVERDWLLKSPEVALLYPAFNDRSEDREAALYSVKSMDSSKKDFAVNTMGAVIEWIPGEEKDIFQNVIEQVLGYDRSIEDISNLNKQVIRLAEETKYDPEKEKIGIEDVRKLLQAAGIKADKIGALDRIYIEETGSLDAEISLDNIVNRRAFTVKTGNGTLKMEPERAHNVEIKVIDGVPCLVLQLEDRYIEVNGMDVNVGGIENED